jgi:hypothetical protein
MTETTVPPLDLTRLDEATFRRLYGERIEPLFRANEAGRLQAVAKFQQWLWVGGALTVLATVLAFAAAARPQAVLAIAVLGAVLTGIVAYQPLAKASKELKRQYCSAIAEAMGAQFAVDGFQPPALERLKAMRLLPSYQRSTFEDLFVGAHKGASYELYEADLQQRRSTGKSTSYVTVFRGQLIRLRFPVPFLGVTIVRRDAGVLNAFGGGDIEGRKLERVRLVDPSFEKAFEVWGTDQVEARYLLHPVMMERLIALETALHGKRIRCAFEDGEMLIAVEGGNLFEPGDMFKPLVDPARARRVVDELASVVRVMDQVLTAQAERPT